MLVARRAYENCVAWFQAYGCNTRFGMIAALGFGAKAGSVILNLELMANQESAERIPSARYSMASTAFGVIWGNPANPWMTPA